jgi:hypothetical protein
MARPGTVLSELDTLLRAFFRHAKTEVKSLHISPRYQSPRIFILGLYSRMSSSIHNAGPLCYNVTKCACPMEQ